MEEEFYKFVSPAEIAKDLNLPKELATKIHKYWALKRKVLYLLPHLISIYTQSLYLQRLAPTSIRSNFRLPVVRIVRSVELSYYYCTCFCF